MEVAGIDPDPWKADFASRSGVLARSTGSDSLGEIMDWTKGQGVDAVVVAASTDSSDPMRTAAQVGARRSVIVAVGDVGMDLDRRALYEKELSVLVSRSYGAGRYVASYESLGVDYPRSYEPQTVQRNLETVVQLIASDRLEVEDLISHRFGFAEAVDAYGIFDQSDPYLGIVLGYEGFSSASPRGSSRANRHVARRPYPRP